jgi:RNA polymerase sigma-70 factor (ECF subfamily)
MGRIDPELKEALWLVYIEELTYKDAALVMGVKPKRVDHLLTRGKEHMRRELAKEGITNAYE